MRMTLLSLPLIWAVGCAQSQSDGPHADTATETASPAPTSNAIAENESQGWPASGEPAASLAELADHIRDRFDEYSEVEKLIYPRGWVRRVAKASGVRHDLQDAEAQQVRGVVHVDYQRQSTLIHPSEEEAAADGELHPYPSLQSKDQLANPLKQPFPQVTVSIDYDLRDTPEGLRWVRTGWTSESAVVEGDDYLEKIGVP